MQRPPPATFVENYETDEPVLELARFMEGGGEDDLGGPLYEECATLLQTDPMALFQKFAQFVEGKMSMGDDDLEGSFHCLFLLLRHLSDEQVQGAIDSLLLLLVKEESRPVTRLKVMANMYALVDFMPSARYPVFLAMVKYARETGHTKVLSAHFQHLETWVAEWSCNADQTVALYWEAVQGLLKMGAEAEATALLHDMLKAADAGDASTIASVGEQAKLACVTAMKDTQTFKFDELLDLRAVQHLSETDPDVFALLRVFVSGKLADYTSLVQSKPALLETLGLDGDVCTLKMRLLSLTSLASASSEVAYKQIAEDLGLTVGAASDGAMPAWMGEVESWVIQAIAAGLIEGRLDQRRGVVEVTRSTQREFHDDDWTAVGDKLSAWRDHVQRMLMVVEKAQ